MAKQVVVLESNQLDPLTMNVRYLLWITKTKAIPLPNAVSQWTGANASETQALKDGTVVEIPKSRTFAVSGTAAALKSQIQSVLAADYTATQAASDSVTQSGQFYGVFFDSSTGWSA